MVFHDHIDEVIDRRCALISIACKRHEGALLAILISHQNLAVQHLVVSEDIVKHFLVQVLRGRLESNFHATCFFRFQIDISADSSMMCL